MWQWRPYAAEMIRDLSGHIRPSEFMGLAWTPRWAIQQQLGLGRIAVPSAFPWMCGVTMKADVRATRHQQMLSCDSSMIIRPTQVWTEKCQLSLASYNIFGGRDFDLDGLVNQDLSSWKWSGNGHFITTQQASLMHANFFKHDICCQMLSFEKDFTESAFSIIFINWK